MIKIPDGTYQMGANQSEGFIADQEGPKTCVHLAAFWMDATTVTNDEFAHFVAETDYVTEAERFKGTELLLEWALRHVCCEQSWLSLCARYSNRLAEKQTIFNKVNE